MMKPKPDELELAIRARNGDQEALADLIERLRVGLFALAYAELRHYEDAQDAVAAALYQICCHAADLRDPTAMRGWMFRIVRNETHRMRRGKQKPPTSIDEAVEAGAEDPSPHLRIDIERALRQLPRDQAQALSLFYLRGWSIVEIARHLTRPVGTVKYWLHQGRQRLAREMKGYRPMKQDWKACIVAPEISAHQLQCITSALMDAGFPSVENVPSVRSLDDLYHTNKSPSVFMNRPGGRIGVSSEGQSVRIVYESQDGQVQINGLLSDQSIVRLAGPLPECDFLLLDERIAGRSVFELLPLLRAIAPTLHICLLLHPPVSDSTYLSCFVTCVTKLHTLREHYSDLDIREYLQGSFTGVRLLLEQEATSE